MDMRRRMELLVQILRAHTLDCWFNQMEGLILPFIVELLVEQLSILLEICRRKVRQFISKTVIIVILLVHFIKMVMIIA